ncbi:MAG: hypothetical protein IKT67_07665 [Lachnospiraceae bacterium]|nr:hypothetical protein [Lachnospiraceae bacterium]
MKNKKRVLIISFAIVFLLVAVFGGIEIYKYNTMRYRLLISESPGNRIVHPGLTYGANSNFGTSKRAMEKGDEIMKEWDEKVANRVLDILLSYDNKEMTLKVEYNVVDGKTEVHLFGEGIPNGETEKEVFDERILLNYLFELNKDVVY